MKKVSEMNSNELLDYVLNNPEYLTNSYYRKEFFEIANRHSELTAQNLTINNETKEYANKQIT